MTESKLLSHKVTKRLVSDAKYQFMLDGKETDYFVELDDPSVSGKYRRWNILLKEEVVETHKMLHDATDAGAKIVLEKYLNKEIQAFCSSSGPSSMEAKFERTKQ